MKRKLMQLLFLSCLKATEIIEKRLYFRISFIEKLQLKVHKMMCDACTLYDKQSLFMDRAIEAVNKKESAKNIEPAKEEIDLLKKRISDKLAGTGSSE